MKSGDKVKESGFYKFYNIRIDRFDKVCLDEGSIAPFELGGKTLIYTWKEEQLTFQEIDEQLNINTHYK